MSDAGAIRRIQRKDTFDLQDDHEQGEPEHAAVLLEHVRQLQGPGPGQGLGPEQGIGHGGEMMYTSDEEHSVLEDDSSNEGDAGDYIDDDDSSSLSIPNESIDFDLMYSLTNFVATVEGQASVVKGDSLFLMDDSNSYWWLVRVLKTQEVGYIPAENIETPFERLARLNRHRNVDLAAPTQQELQEGANRSRENLRLQMSSRSGPSPLGNNQRTESRNATIDRRKSISFGVSSSIMRYPPAVWNEEEEEEEGDDWEENEVEYEVAPINDEVEGHSDEEMMEPDDGMNWEDTAVNDLQAHQMQIQMQLQMQQMQNQKPALQGRRGPVPPPLQLEATARPDSQITIVQTDPGQSTQQLRPQTSRERLLQQQQQEGKGPGSSDSHSKDPSPVLDPAEATETKKLTVTPAVAQDRGPAPRRENPNGPQLPSVIMQQQQQQQELERKRAREEIEAAEEAARKRQALKGKDKEIVRTPSIDTRSSTSSHSTGKLRKEPHVREVVTDDESSKSGKKKGFFGKMFGGKKDKEKGKDKGGYSDSETIRGSEESGKSSGHGHFTASPPEGAARQGPVVVVNGRPPQSSNSVRSAAAPQDSQPTLQGINQDPSTPPKQSALQVSAHASQLRERDQQQQALYQQYLKRSPSSPPEQPSYGLQSAPAVMPSLTNSPPVGLGLGLPPVAGSFRGHGGRPGSLIITGGLEGQGIGLPELSVIRVFAGKHLQSEATFKTVLLNSSTTASDLVRQAMQRFRLAAGENREDYYLTVKQVEGSSMVLRADEKPLGVFEQLVEEALEMPKVKRSSMGSISSVASNLSQHPAIKLAMNDFTDDSAVKIYLNRRSEGEYDDSFGQDDEVAVTLAETTSGELADSSSVGSSSVMSKNQFLTVNSSIQSSVSPERFSSPSFRFALQLVIYPEDLPDDMIFDPQTEAIVFKETVRDRLRESNGNVSGVSQNQRKKVLVFPKNITVAEVIELGLERFGILEGVVDGGDEVEDKTAKRRSSVRVRYSLAVQVDGQERELTPSSKVIEAFPRPPVYRRSTEMKRRSMDSSHFLAYGEDVQADDPVFVLRRAVTYRSVGTSRHRLSAALDEVALSHLHRGSSASNSTRSTSVSVSATNSDASTVQAPSIGSIGSSGKNIEESTKSKQPSRQEIIAAQRAASRANQKAILSAQTNAHRGVDVILPGRAMLRSSRYEVDDRVRYSYVQPDGETLDISDIVEEELKGSADDTERAYSASPTSQMGDLLRGVVNGFQPGLGAQLIDRVLNKITGKTAAAGSGGSNEHMDQPRSSEDRHDTDGQTLTVSHSVSATTLPSSATSGSYRSTSPSIYSLNEQDELGDGRRDSGARTPTGLAALSLAQRAFSPAQSDMDRTISPQSFMTAATRPRTESSASNATAIARPRTTTPSSQSTVYEHARATSPTNPPPRTTSPTNQANPQGHVRNTSALNNAGGRSRTPSLNTSSERPHHYQRPSLASVFSEMSAYRSSSGTPPVEQMGSQPRVNGLPHAKKFVLEEDFFGLKTMFNVIEAKAYLSRPKAPEKPASADIVDDLLFGYEIQPMSLHPAIREVYAGTLKQLEEDDIMLDDLLHRTMKLLDSRPDA